VVAAALYEPAGDEYRPTKATRSPWHPAAQHGGPPAALALREIEAAAGPEMAVMRFDVHLFGEVPVVPLRVVSHVIRPGRKVALHEAEVTAGGKVVVKATAWVVRRTEVALPELPDALPDPPPPPESLPPLEFRFNDYEEFAGAALDKRLISGQLAGPGRAAVWLRLTLPLVAGEPTTPFQQLAAIADSGNGVSWALPIDRYLFINTDLSIAPYRPPAGEWFALDSVSHLHPSGRGTAYTDLFDRDGWLGRSSQSLYVSER